MSSSLVLKLDLAWWVWRNC